MYKRCALITVCLMIFLKMAGTTVCLSEEWYMQGTIGYESSRDANFKDEPSSDTADFFGQGKGEDGKSLGAYGDFGRFPVVEVAIGRRIAPWLRMDIETQYRWNMAYRGNANFLSVGEDQPGPCAAWSPCSWIWTG